MARKAVRTPTLATEVQKQLVDDAIEHLGRHAESQLEMVRLFIDRGKIEIASRRLREVIELDGESDAAKEAKKLIN